MATITTPIAYFFSRRFVDAYYGAIGIPEPAISLGVQDYMFGAASNWPFVFLIGSLTTVMVGGIRYLLQKNDNLLRPSSSTPAQWISSWIAVGTFVIFAVITMLIAVWQIIDDVPAEVSNILLLSASLLALMAGLVAISDSSVWGDKKLAVLTVSATAILIGPLLLNGPEAWGGSAGSIAVQSENISSSFSTVAVYSDNPPFGIGFKWMENDQSFVSEELFLILETSNRSWLIPKNDQNTIVGISKSRYSTNLIVER